MLVLDIDRERFSRAGVFFGSGRDRATIGRNPGFRAGFTGLIDNVFIYKRVLSDARIDDMRARGLAAILPAAAQPNGDLQRLQLAADTGSSPSGVVQNPAAASADGRSRTIC